jgi:hypothetical protein
MSKLSFTLCIIASAIPLLWVQAQPGEAKAGTAAISGRVTLNGEAVANTVVALQNPPGPSRSPGIRVKTDGAGRFRFTGVAAGRYVLGALAPGFISLSDNPWGPQGNLITVSEAENMEGLSIELKRGGAIAGRVTDSRRRAIAEENVVLMKLDEQGRPQRFDHPMYNYIYITDDRGYYRIFGLPAGRYLVSVGQKPQEVSYGLGQRRIFYPQTFHTDATGGAEAKVIELSEGGEVTGVDITVAEMKRAYTVSGRIADAETGQSVAGMDIAYSGVMADGNRAGLWGMSLSDSDAKGGFQFTLMPGKYSLFGGRSRGDYFTDPAPIDVGDKDVSGVEIKARRGATISGVVAIEGMYDRSVLPKLPALTIEARRLSGDLMYLSDRSARINPDGGFRISGLSPGKITLSLAGQFDVNKFSILRIERGGIPLGRQIEVGAGEQAHNLRVVLGYGVAAIRGQLKIIGGAMPSDITVHAYANRVGADQSANVVSQVDASGQFVIEGLTAGEYELSLSYRFRVNSANANPPILQKFLQQLQRSKQTVSVGATGATKVILTFDLSQKEGQ